MLIIDRKDLKRNLLAYGEEAASARVRLMSEEDYQRVCEIGFQHAMTGMLLMKAGCLAAIEVLEGQPRELKRKRRVWADTQHLADEPDPAFIAVLENFKKYAGGRRVRKKEILDGVSEALAKVLLGFKYYRTYSHFLKTFADGTLHIGLDYAHQDLALRFGVCHERIEETRARLFDSEWQPSKFSAATISKYSVNMGPQSPHWNYPTETTWPISGSEGLKLAANEIVTFVKDIVLPYVVSHQDPAAIRETLLTSPGHVDQTLGGNEQTIFAIDRFLGKRDWLDEDCQRLRASLDALEPRQGRVARGVAAKQRLIDKLIKDYETAIARWGN